jgi:hypothetical protein
VRFIERLLIMQFGRGLDGTACAPLTIIRRFYAERPRSAAGRGAAAPEWLGCRQKWPFRRPSGGRPWYREPAGRELAVHDHAADDPQRAVGYAWADPEAERIGINLRWMQASCSLAI